MRNHLTSLFLSFIYGSSPAPDPIRLSLEATSAKWFRGVWICGLVVAIGCASESWEVTFALRNWFRARKEREELKDNPRSLRHPLAAIGLFLVIGGIVGETVFESLKKVPNLSVSDTAWCIGEGSTMYVPAHTKPDDAFIFVGAKPIAEETWQNKANSSPCTKK